MTDEHGYFGAATPGQTASNGTALNPPVPGTLEITWEGTDVRYHINLLRT
jgi:hypothetical protein